MEQDREFYIMWCTLLSGDAESYFEKMTDQQLEEKYYFYLGEMEKDIEGS